MTLIAGIILNHGTFNVTKTHCGFRIQTYRQPVRIHIERRLSAAKTTVVATHRSNLIQEHERICQRLINPEQNDRYSWQMWNPHKTPVGVVNVRNRALCKFLLVMLEPGGATILQRWRQRRSAAIRQWSFGQSAGTGALKVPRLPRRNDGSGRGLVVCCTVRHRARCLSGGRNDKRINYCQSLVGDSVLTRPRRWLDAFRRSTSGGPRNNRELAMLQLELVLNNRSSEICIPTKGVVKVVRGGPKSTRRQ